MDNKALNYKFLKLSNGENILCMTDDNCENLAKKKHIHILEPVLVTPFRFPRGLKIMETFIMQPWVPFSDDKVFEISTSAIIMATDVHDEFKQQYEKYIESSEQKGEPEIENQGELNAKDYEDLLSQGRESDEEETEQFDYRGISGRTLH